MAYCRECGNQINDNSVICTNCGCATGIKQHNKSISISKRLTKLFISIICTIGILCVSYFLWKVGIIDTNFDKVSKQETLHNQIQSSNIIKNKEESKSTGVYALYSRDFPFYDDYDNKRITGHMVKTSYLEMGTEDFTYLIHTNAMSDNVNQYSYTIKIDGLVYTNYGTLIREEHYTDLNDRTFSVFNPFMPDKGYNNRFSNWTEQNSDEFINSTSAFNSELLRNENGIIIGVMFTEENKVEPNYTDENLYEDYNGTVVTGITVKAAFQNFYYKPLAILVHTKDMNDEKYDLFGSHDKINGLRFVNYNACFDFDIYSDLEDNVISSNDYFEENYGFVANMAIPGKADMNGMGHFDNTTKFDASLIKTEKGEVVGLMFIEKVE